MREYITTSNGVIKNGIIIDAPTSLRPSDTSIGRLMECRTVDDYVSYLSQSAYNIDDSIDNTFNHNCNETI